MMAENKSVVAPMLDSQSAYSNFWCGITPQVSASAGPVSQWRHVSRKHFRLKAMFTVCVSPDNVRYSMWLTLVQWTHVGHISVVLILFFSGLLPAYGRVLPHSTSPPAGLFPSSHGALHHAAGPA